MSTNVVIGIYNTFNGGYLSEFRYNDKRYVKFSEKVVEIAWISEFTLYVFVNI